MRFSVKPFAQFGLGDKQQQLSAAAAAAAMSGLVGMPGSPSAPPSQAVSAAPTWHGRAIATRRLRLLEFSAYVEQQQLRDSSDLVSNNTHRFVHIDGPVSYADPLLEPIDVQQIQDKFPEKKGGLNELYAKGPADAFFLVKFWADLNTNIADESNTFYGVTTT